MMMPPIYPLLRASSAVTSLLGSNPLRAFPFAEAPQAPVYPYVTWQVISGQPENYLAQLPDNDDWNVQVDVWASSAASALSVAEAVRDALEPHCYMTDVGNTDRDVDTQSYRYRMDFEIFSTR